MLTKVKIGEVATQTVPELKDVFVKQEESEAHIEEKYESIPCKYFHTIKGCRRGIKCWFFHNENPKLKKKSSKLKQNKNVKGEPNVEKTPNQEQVVSLTEVSIELIKKLLQENNIRIGPIKGL